MIAVEDPLKEHLNEPLKDPLKEPSNVPTQPSPPAAQHFGALSPSLLGDREMQSQEAPYC